MTRSNKNKSGSKDTCIYCGVYLPPISAVRRKKSAKVKAVKWAKSYASNKDSKRKVLSKKPTPYPVKRKRVPKLNPKNQPETSNDSCALSSIMDAMGMACENDPVLKGIMYGLELGYKYNHGDRTSQYPECMMQTQMDQTSTLSGNSFESSNNLRTSLLSNKIKAELLDHTLRNLAKACGHPVAGFCNIEDVTSVPSLTDIPLKDGSSPASIVQADASSVINGMLIPADPMLKPDEDSAQIAEVCPNEKEDEAKEPKIETDVVSQDNK